MGRDDVVEKSGQREPVLPRIVFVNTRYRPPQFRGGVERYVHIVAGELSTRNLCCSVVAMAESLPCVSQVPHDFLRIPPIPLLRPFIFGILGRRFWQKADLIAVQYTPFGALIPKQKLVCTVHTTGFGEARALTGLSGARVGWQRLRRRISMPVEGMVLRRARRVIAISSSIAQELVDIYGVDPAKITVIGNGVDCDAFRPGSTVKGHSPLRVLYVGRLAKRKNVNVLIEAAAGASVPVILRVVGTGPEQKSLAALVDRCGESANIEFRGYRSGSELLAEYQWADAFAIPSSYEGVPLAALEAKAAGLPVIAANFPGAENLVSPESGIVVSPADSAGFVRAFQLLDRDHDRLRDMARHSRQEALEKFSWPVPAGRLGDVYQEVLCQSA